MKLIKLLIFTLLFSLLANFAQAETVLVHAITGECIDVVRITLNKEGGHRCILLHWKDVTTCLTPESFDKSVQIRLDLDSLDLTVPGDNTRTKWENNVDAVLAYIKLDESFGFTDPNWLITNVN